VALEVLDGELVNEIDDVTLMEAVGVRVRERDDVTDTEGVALRVGDKLFDGVSVIEDVEELDRDLEEVTLIVGVLEAVTLIVGDLDGVTDGLADGTNFHSSYPCALVCAEKYRSDPNTVNPAGLLSLLPE
jgi:hypothetical protein